jgi:hypothetical protein
MGRTYYWKTKQELFSLDDEKLNYFQLEKECFLLSLVNYMATFTEVFLMIVPRSNYLWSKDEKSELVAIFYADFFQEKET